MFQGVYQHACHPESAVCAFCWGTWGITLFFQREDHTIIQSYHNGDWRDTSFQIPNCLPGTDLAEVHTDGGRRIILFFQDSFGWLCYRQNDYGQWGPATPICPAARKTGIAATSWTGDLSEVRVYFQDEDNAIREYVGAFGCEWHQTSAVICQHTRPLGSLAAISWESVDQEHYIRLYFQDDRDTIIEMCYGSSTPMWSKGKFAQRASRGTSISASVRTHPGHVGRFINIMWSDMNSNIKHCANSMSVGWLQATTAAKLRNNMISFPGSKRSNGWR